MSAIVAPKSIRHNRLQSRLSLSLFAWSAESWILACETVACEQALQSPFARGSRVTFPNGAKQSWATATCELSPVSLSLFTLAPDLSFEESSGSSPLATDTGYVTRGKLRLQSVLTTYLPNASPFKCDALRSCVSAVLLFKFVHPCLLWHNLVPRGRDPFVQRRRSSAGQKALGTRLPLVASFCICCVIYTFFSGF